MSFCHSGANVISGFPSKRTNLSPFTKDFRGGEHSNEYNDISYGHLFGGLLRAIGKHWESGNGSIGCLAMTIAAFDVSDDELGVLASSALSSWGQVMEMYVWSGLVRIRHLRPNRTIAEPWDEGERFEEAKWTSPRWPRLTLRGATTGAMPRVWLSSQGDHHCRGTAVRPPLCPVGDVH